MSARKPLGFKQFITTIFIAYYAALNLSASDQAGLRIVNDEMGETISVYRSGNDDPILTQNARQDFRPYLHPIAAPDGRGVVTENSPGHHPHETGLYWGFTRVNGRDFFHHPGGDHWRRVSARIIENQKEDEDHVQWQTVYEILDEQAQPILTETQTWTMREANGTFTLDLEWRGTAQTDISIGASDYGGLFLRMPWREGTPARVVNAVRDRGERANRARAMWLDVGMQVEGRDDLVHVAIFDHPENAAYPTPWRVNGQMGVGPSSAILGNWAIEAGQTEVVRHRILIYTEDLSEMEITAAWEDYVNNHGTYSTAAMWKIAQAEGYQAEFLTPDEAAEAMTLIDGFHVTAWAGEPDLTSPMAFAWDDRGRLWIAENNDYQTRGTGFSSAGNSRILILEDTDRDGRADSRKVFLEGIAFPAALAVGFDGLFLGAPPNLLFIPNRGDDVPDLEHIEVLLTGWGIDDRHETINSLHWGPDGWLYGLQGFATHSIVGKAKPGAKALYARDDPFPESLEDLLDGEGTRLNGGVWRYHPIHDRFEVVAHGFSNPWGIDHDAKGQLFATACVIPHLWHIIPGGLYHRQGGSHFHPYVYDDIQTIADHRHRSAHGGASIYLSDAFPESQRGRIFMANIHEHAVLSDVLERQGSGFTARHGDDFLMANNDAWVGFSTAIGPDGGLYILDWHDRDICGSQVLNEDTGRIFKVMPDVSLADEWEGRYDDISTLTDEQLVALQTRNSAWHARRARLNLQVRSAKGELAEDTHEILLALFRDESNPDWRLRAMWALHVTGGFSDSDLIEALSHDDEYVRSWAVQMLAENLSVPESALEKFRQMARQDQSPVVRLYLASALQRLDDEQRWEIAEQLMMRGEDENDHNIPKMIWFGFEPLVEANPVRALALAGRSKLRPLARFASRRAVEAEAFEALVGAIGNLPERKISMLEGMKDGLEGRRSDLTPPPNWPAVYAALRKSKEAQVAQLALDIAQQFGDTDASLSFLAVLSDRDAPTERRRETLRVLADEQNPGLAERLPALLDEPGLRMAAIRAVAGFDDEQLGRFLMARYPDFDQVEQNEIIRAMASRPTYGKILTEALKSGDVPKRDVPVDVARQLQRVVGVGFVDVWGPIGNELTANEIAHAKYTELIENSSIADRDAHRGRSVFQRTCGACHRMYGTGGTIGPDLTGSNRQNVDYILRMVIDPNEVVADNYRLVMITMRDGRTYSGNIASESERQLTLRTVGSAEEIVLNKSDIQAREDTGISLMPPRLFDTLSDSEVLDLIAYLQTKEQVDLPKE